MKKILFIGTVYAILMVWQVSRLAPLPGGTDEQSFIFKLACGGLGFLAGVTFLAAWSVARKKKDAAVGLFISLTAVFAIFFGCMLSLHSYLLDSVK